MNPPSPRGRRGFTVLELLCATAILAVLLLIVLGLGGNLREKSYTARCAANLKQIGAVTALYVAEHDGFLPHYPPTSSDASLGYATVGSWYWHLAPYLNIPRSEKNLRSILGPDKETGLPGPVVFTCPGQKQESYTPDQFQRHFTYPSLRPVSYAPSHRMRSETPLSWKGEEGRFVSPVRLRDIREPSQKIWLSDSPSPDAMNVSNYRWLDDCAPQDAYPRWGFSRHHGGGNALFCDGHVEWIALSAIREGDFQANLYRLFFPFR
ncbi:MAG TPA: H-X9-DG-CTERM domain-containing protein [Chthoniobacteraceae bacterium]|nr:H-X9-DG-CTERM domain-containing protein [Chthoniobacteraceae bacterium]